MLHASLQEAAAAAAALTAARAGESTVPELQQMLDEVRLGATHTESVAPALSVAVA